MLKQILFILTGFLIGQGSMFLVQTYLVTNGLFELVANIGISIGLLSLIQWTADGGGVFLLSKLVKENKITNLLQSFIYSRVIFAFSFLILIYSALLFININSTVIQALCFSPLIVIIWAFNLTGIADSLNKNKIIGPLSNLNWLFCSFVVLLCKDNINLGYYLGAAFCIGLLLSVVIQYLVLKIKLSWIVDTNNIKKCIKMITNYNVAYIFSQSYARFIPILVDSSINSTMAGTYVYAKNLSNMVSQFIQFTRRVEFNKILLIAKNAELNIFNVIKTQKYSLLGVLIPAVLSCLVTVFIYFYEINVVIHVANLSTLLLCILFVWLISSTYGQLCIAKGLLRFYGNIMAITSTTSAFLMYLFIDELGISALSLIHI